MASSSSNDRHAFEGTDKKKPCVKCGKKYIVGKHF